MSERQDFGRRNSREAPQGVDGFYLLGRYYMLAKLQGDLAHVSQVLKDNDKYDEATLGGLLKVIREKVNTASSSRLGDKITMDDVTRYIRESLERD